MNDWRHALKRVFFFWEDGNLSLSSFNWFSIAGILGVKIRELSVPSMVELGSENILLDCDFDYNDTERIQLDIKWYFEDEPSPFYQWVPEQMARPQIIGEKFRQHIDLDHVVHTDSHKKHRALLLKKPTTELSGSYTCKVSTFVSEDVRRKKMIVFCKFIRNFFFILWIENGWFYEENCYLLKNVVQAKNMWKAKVNINSLFFYQFEV